MYCYTQCPQPCSWPPPTHASTGDSWTLTVTWMSMSNLSYILYSSIVNNLIICKELAFPHASLSFYVWFFLSEMSPQPSYGKANFSKIQLWYHFPCEAVTIYRHTLHSSDWIRIVFLLWFSHLIVSLVSHLLWYLYYYFFQLLSRVPFFVTQWTAACQAPLFFTISWSLFQFICIESVILSSYLILCLPLLLLLSIFPSMGIFSMSWL